MDIMNTRHGKMFRIERKRCVDLDVNGVYEEWIEADRIIGFRKSRPKDEYGRDRSENLYHLIVSFTQGYGINGTGSEIEVTERCYDSFVKYVCNDGGL